MGWYGSYKPKGVSIQDYMQKEIGDSNVILASSLKNLRTWYAAVRDSQGSVYGMVCLVDFTKRNDGTNFTYKPIDESMGPYERDCPVHILDFLTPTESANANEWRENCRKNLIAKKKTQILRDGDVVKFSCPMKFSNGATLDTFTVFKVGRRVRFRHHVYGLCAISKYHNREFVVVEKEVM